MHISFLYGWILLMSVWLHVLDASSEPRTPYSHRQLRQPLRYIAVSSVLATPPLPIRQHGIGTHRMVSDTRHNSELILARSDSSLRCLHLALDFIPVLRRHENMSLCTDSRVHTNYERTISYAVCQQRTADPIVSQAFPPTNAVSSALNTHPWPIR